MTHSSLLEFYQFSTTFSWMNPQKLWSGVVTLGHDSGDCDAEDGQSIHHHVETIPGL
jgi:hypothetical protein